MSTTDKPGHGNFIVAPTAPKDWRSSQNDKLWGIGRVNNPCPTGYRVPTEAEFKDELASWSSNNAAEAFASPLKLTVTGWRDPTGTLGNVGTVGFYWTSSVSGTNGTRFYFNNKGAGIGFNDRAHGMAVRCIKN